MTQQYQYDHPTLVERISIAETELLQVREDLKDIKSKLDELIELKSKGLGAIWLISLIVGSGFVGFIANLFSNKGH